MVHIRPNAAKELQRLLDKQPDQRYIVRLELVSGGCYEWTYHLTLTTTYNQHQETLYRFDTFTLVLANDAVPLLEDLIIDFAEDLMGGGFRFINPQAQQICGCGNSFSLTPATESTGITEDCTQTTWQIPALNN